MYRTLTVTTSMGQSGSGSNDNGGVEVTVLLPSNAVYCLTHNTPAVDIISRFGVPLTGRCVF